MTNPIYCEGDCCEVLTDHGRRVQLCGTHATLWQELQRVSRQLMDAQANERIAHAGRDGAINNYTMVLYHNDQLRQRVEELESQCQQHLENMQNLDSAKVTELQDTLEAVKQAIAHEFKKKNYTEEDRQHEDVLENLGTFLDHHNEIEQQLAERDARIAEIENELTSAEMRSVAHLKMFTEASHQLAQARQLSPEQRRAYMAMEETRP